MSAATPIADLSPYARAIGELAALGYHAIPIMPLEKAPGEYKGGRWWRMKEWQRFRDRAPTEFERGLWARNMPAANVGVVLGTPAGHNLRLVAVDVDTTDPDEFDTIVSVLPYSPMVKRGAKGETRFYRAPADVKSRAYSHAGDKHRLVDMLTGNETRQTVVPPSVHVDKQGRPTGYIYAWLAGPVRADELPVFGEDELEKLEDTLRHLGWNPDAERPPLPARDPEDGDTIWREVNNAALANIEAWVHDLGLYKLRRSGGRYECVGTWRPSSTGRALEQRNPNLKIHPSGIRDFHEDKTYTPIDVVMYASGRSREEATDWLRGKLGLQDPEPIILQPRPKAAEAFDPETGEVLEEPVRSAQLDELPDELTRVPGLLGELTDWITDTAMRPQRCLSHMAACAIVGTAAGRKYGGPTRSGTHLYMLIVAASAKGKDHPLKAIPRVFNACGLSNLVGGGQFMSLSSLVNRIVREPLTISCMDEFGSFMAKLKNRKAGSHEAAIPAFMRELWSASFSSIAPPEWADKVLPQIHSPSFTIFGATTPEQFYDAIGGDDINNGFLNRFLLMSTRQRSPRRDPLIDPFVVPQPIKDGILAVVGSGSALARATSNNGQADGPLITAAWASNAAKDVYEDLIDHLEESEEEQPLFGRTAEMAVRLATIRAVGIDPQKPKVTVEDITWGRDLAIWSAERMVAEVADYMAENQTQADAKKIIRIVRERGPLKHSELLRAVQHTIRGRDLKDLLQMLVDAGDIVAIEGEKPARGPTPVSYSAARR